VITISRTESVYPGSLDTFVHATTDFNPGDAVPSSDFEKLLDAVKKIETELGTDPAGASTDLVTRLAAVTAAEFGEVANIGATTISAAQWGYLGACGAGGGQLLAALTTGESDQLELIGATTISAAQWGYLGAMTGTPLGNIVEDTTPQLGGELDCQAHSVGFTQQTATGDGTTTIDWKLGNKFYFTFGAQNDTFTFTAPTHECNLLLVLKQDGTGGRTATWPVTVLWPAGTAPTLSTGINAIDIIAFYYDGTNYFGVSNLNFS